VLTRASSPPFTSSHAPRTTQIDTLSLHDALPIYEHDQHQGHNHGDHDHSHHHEEMVEDFKRRFYVSLVITIPILILSPMIQSFLSVDWRFVNDQYILFILSTLIFFYGGWPFVTGAVD